MVACAQCSKEDAKMKCSKCKSVTYCGRACQMAAWKTHKASCAVPWRPAVACYVDEVFPKSVSEARSWAAAPELARRGSPASPMSCYPPGFVAFAGRLSERNWACFAAALGGRSRYYDVPCRDGGYRVRRFENVGVPSEGVVDGAHPQLQSAADGSNLCDGGRVVAACGPGVRALALATLKSTVSAASLAEAVGRCGRLKALVLTECAVDAAAFEALPETVVSLRFGDCVGLDDAALAAALRATPRLAYLDVESRDSDAVPGPLMAPALRNAALRALRVSDRGVRPGPLLDAAALAGALERESRRARRAG